MPQDVAFRPGCYPKHGGPLQRYLPPLLNGPAAAWLSEQAEPGSWVLDPFGASPRLAVEVARNGYRLLVAVNNPISRFLIEIFANPPKESEFVASLAEISAAQKGGERIEPQIRALYQTNCSQCGAAIESQAFVWDSATNALVGKVYSCNYCKDSGERPASPGDIARAARGAASPLHRARALERVAPLADPDRGYAEEALAMYPPRAVYILFNLINRLESISAAHRRCAEALLLAVFDQANGLWGQTPTRTRPRQLNLPPRYLEKNIWLSLEETSKSWSDALHEVNRTRHPISISLWPDLPDDAGGICLFEGRLRDLVGEMHSSPKGKITFSAVVGAIPRPNQAFWTLSALWAGWLWGHAASARFKSVLRRRRFDWGWHTIALTSALTGVSELILNGTPCLGMIGETDPGFLSSALLAGEFSRLALVGTALRNEPEQAQITWRRKDTRLAAPLDEASRRSLIRQEALGFLRMYGEPASYIKLQTAALSSLVRSHSVAFQTGGTAADALRQFDEAIEAVLSYTSQFIRLGASGRALDAGKWWLAENALPAEDIALPLADRVEMRVVKILQTFSGINLQDLEAAVYREEQELFTPDLALIQTILESYGIQDSPDSGKWRLRQNDEPISRQKDLKEMYALLSEIGNKLGFTVDIKKISPQNGIDPPLLWRTSDGNVPFQFFISSSGLLGRILTSAEVGDSIGMQLIVIPGGRSNLITYKLRKDGRLKAIAEQSWSFIKFRHVRWLAEHENLNLDNLNELLGLDPLEKSDPQMQLL